MLTAEINDKYFISVVINLKREIQLAQKNSFYLMCQYVVASAAALKTLNARVIFFHKRFNRNIDSICAVIKTSRAMKK